MSTSALVGIQNSDGTVSAIYNQFDGYVDGGLGLYLLDNVTDEDQVRDIIAMGGASSIEGDTYYARDRGENLSILKFKTVDDFSNEAGNFSYIYIYTADEWMVKKGSRGQWFFVEDLVERAI